MKMGNKNKARALLFMAAQKVNFCILLSPIVLQCRRYFFRTKKCFCFSLEVHTSLIVMARMFLQKKIEIAILNLILVYNSAVMMFYL